MHDAAPLGLIAGRGELPLVVCMTAKRRGVSVHAIVFDSETAGKLAPYAEVNTFGIGQAGKIIDHFKGCGISRVCMIGKIEKGLIFKNPKFDFRTLRAMGKMLHKSDASILHAVIDELGGEGIEVVKQTDWLPDLLPARGLLGKKRPTPAMEEDFRLGFETCRELAGREIGQTVIVKEGVILAVEAVEGTDAAIKRGCALGGKGAVMVKTGRPNQDLRFDIPSVGRDTVKLLAAHKAAGLAIEAERTVLIDRPETVSLCDKAGIVLTAL